MKSLSTLLFVALFTFLLNGCGIGAIASMVVNRGDHTMPDYTPSQENQKLLTQMAKEGYKIALKPVVSTQENNQTVHCRVMTSVTPPKHQNYRQYLYHAFKTELKQAKIYDENNSVAMQITLQTLKGSSMYGDASWLIGIEIASNNGEKYSISTNYTYDSSFRASSACKDMHKTFPLALQKLIYKTITNPQFKKLFTKKRK